MTAKKQILLTNDDGIQSPGLWIAAEALAPLGYINVTAPRSQSTGAGRSMPAHSDGSIFEQTLTVKDQPWTVYAVDGTPAQVVQHALVELLPHRPDLVVAGINYGENVGSGVTISGTVGAALEAASFGIPALAISLQMASEYHLSYSTDIDFSAAKFFTEKFARLMLNLPHVPDVDVLKIEIPEGATPDTPWRLTRVSRNRYYLPQKPARANLSDKARIGYRRNVEAEAVEPDSDVRALLDGVVAVTPISLDMTSRVDMAELTRLLNQDGLA